MTFEKAIEQMKLGEKIKRSHWRKCFIFMDRKNEKLKMSYQGWEKSWHYSPKNHDLFATDWLIDTNRMYED